MKTILTLVATLVFLLCGPPKTKENESSTPVKESSVDQKDERKIIGTGRITTIADGFDVRRVNLFSSTASTRQINCFLTSRDEVNILEETSEYFFVEKVGDQKCKGYCMKGFVIVKTITK